MTPREFVRKWRAVELKERSAAQEHFLDLCRLMGHESPAALDPKGEFFCFEMGAAKRGGDDGFADVWKKGFFAWEYKGKHANLDKAWEQLDRYRADLENPPLLVTCDTARIEIHTSFQNTKHHTYRIELEELTQPEKLEFLRAVFFDPEKLRPGRISPVVTAEAAKALGELALRLRGRDFEPRAVARFLDRVLFALFAEDIGLLPNEIASKLFEAARGKPELFEQLVGELFQKMAAGGFFGVDRIPHVNGSLFDDASTLPLSAEELELLAQAARLDWSAIDPSIFGTLFERGLDPAKRAQLGAHYTSREDIETLVEPVVMTPLRREWAETKALVGRLLATGSKKEGAPEKKLSGAELKKARAEAEIFLVRYLERLEAVKVLDPACGSGNFLYVTLRKLKDLESEVYDFFLECGLHVPLRVGVGPWQLYGIEINAYAHELAQMTVWIGYLQWLRQHGTTTWKEPILQAMSNIECKDAILDLTDPANPKEPDWPKVDFIVSNPPFLGSQLMRRELGDEYVTQLRALYEDRLPGQADLCCYWFEKARSGIEGGRALRAGLLATQGIRGGGNRRVLERIKATGDIFWAQSDREWILDGAAVHVSMVGFDNGHDIARILDGQVVVAIHAGLTSGVAVGSAARLSAQPCLSFQGPVKVGAFDLPSEDAIPWLLEPNPHGLPNSDVLRPWLTGRSITTRDEGVWIVDFAERSLESASLYGRPFAHIREHVLPERSKNRRGRRRELWWMHGEINNALRQALSPIPRYMGLCQTAKYRPFVWVESPYLPAQTVIAFATDCDWVLGVLQSRSHEVWALAQGTQLREKESGFRYTPTTCFETFPFPSMNASQEARIAAAAAELDGLRRAWLDPPEWTKEEVLEFPGSVDGPWRRFVHDPDARGIGTVRWPRIVAKDAECAAKLAKRTLTNLYNERPAWLDLAHRKLDEAVFDAYGWPADLSDEQILERLLALNLERAADS
jgi:type II restriction/modification system DNA methylase subunit YeeA